MQRVKHDGGFVDLEGVKAISWQTDTQATIWWGNGLIGVFTFSEETRMLVDVIAEMDQMILKDHLGKIYKEHYRATTPSSLLDHWIGKDEDAALGAGTEASAGEGNHD